MPQSIVPIFKNSILLERPQQTRMDLVSLFETTTKDYHVCIDSDMYVDY